MRAIVVLLFLVACRNDSAPTEQARAQTTMAARVAPAAATSDAACANPCGPAPTTICCGVHDKCCAEGVAAHFYCYDGPGDCPARP